MDVTDVDTIDAHRHLSGIIQTEIRRKTLLTFLVMVMKLLIVDIWKRLKSVNYCAPIVTERFMQ